MVMRMLSVPLKKSYEVDLGGPLRSYIASAYSTEDCPPDSEAINEFCRLRSKACCVQHDKQEGSLEVLYRYYDQLVSLEGKLPFNHSQIIVPFKWKEAFERSLFGKASLTITSGSYEKACVMFNIAALQSQVAAAQRIEADNELKIAAKLFESSASIFAYLKDNIMIMVQQEPTADLIPETLHALSTLMLAQAQEAFYTKASKEKLKPALIAKVASECAYMYYEAHKLLSREGFKGMWDKDWIPIATAKCFAYQALAQYHQSLEAKESKEIGEELARLQYAVELMQMAQGKLPSSLSQLFASFSDTIEKAHSAAKKDNDFIYHERVPNIKAVPAITKTAIAKITPLPSRLSAKHRDLFDKLIPVSVQQAIARFDVRKAEVLNREIGKLREYTNMLNDLLSSLNLPTALEDVCKQEILPASIKEKSTKVKSMGSWKAMESAVAELPTFYQRNNDILNETRRILNEEKTSDQQLREQFKERWTRMKSEDLTSPLWLEIQRCQETLEAAKKSDGIVREKFNEHSQGIAMLSKSEDELRAEIPGLPQTLIAIRDGNAAAKLQELMTKVETVKQQRVDLEKEFRNVTFDISSIFLKALSESSVIPEDEISNEQLEQKLSPLLEKVVRSIEEQERLTDQILAANEQFVKEKGQDSSEEREIVLRQLTKAHDAFLELIGSVNEGQKFYNDMMPFVVRLQQKASDFCFARKTEKDDLMQDMQKNIIQPRLQQDLKNTQRKPPRPPPPSVPQGGDAVLKNAPRLSSGVPERPAAPPPNAVYVPYPVAASFYATYPGAVPTPYPYNVQQTQQPYVVGQMPQLPPYQQYPHQQQ